MILQAKDLMVGDWVKVKSIQKQVKVKEIKQSCIYTEDNGYEYNEIESILLTPYILEKNGWSNETFNRRQEWWLDKTKFPIIRYSTDGILQHNGIILKYVHRLQQALRVCGFEKQIEI